MNPGQWVVVSPSSLRASAVGTQVLAGLGGLVWIVGSLGAWMVADMRLNPGSQMEDMSPLLTIPLSLWIWPPMLVAGAMWGGWQRSLAHATLVLGPVRTPTWHAQAWWCPIVGWWEPLRNIRALSGLLLPPGEAWLVRAWWPAWILFRVSIWVVIWQLWILPEWLLPPGVAGVLVVVQAVATLLAIAVVQRMTDHAIRRLHRPAQPTPYWANAAPPAPYWANAALPAPIRGAAALTVIGVALRVAAPILILMLLAGIRQFSPALP